MSKFIVDYSNSVPSMPDGRLDGPAFHRNHAPIWSTIDAHLQDKTGDVLEIGSGTGQHAVEFARRSPHLAWWPSDIYPSHLASIAAWRTHARLANLHAPQRLDLSGSDWTWTGQSPTGGLTAIVCINVLHISPWRVSQNLMTGAGRLLRDDGRLLVYGPFMRDSAHTAPSNEAFDTMLRAENPEWGVRDIGDLNKAAKAAGLTLAETVAMPADNQVLVFARAARPA